LYHSARLILVTENRKNSRHLNLFREMCWDSISSGKSVFKRHALALGINWILSAMKQMWGRLPARR